MRRFSLFSLAFALIVSATALFADVFVIKDAGTLDGELLNPDEVPRKTYNVRTASGIEIHLNAKLVERVRKSEKESVAEYNAFAPFLENTVENHLEIAEWCQQQQLPDFRKRHLFRVLHLDPDNTAVRQLLGHIKLQDGSWTTREEMLSGKGMIQVGTSWKPRQQIDLEQHFEKKGKLEKEWGRRVDALRSSIRDPKSQVELATIDAPLAAGALTRALPNEPKPEVRILLIQALGNVGTSAALHEVARWSIEEPNDEVRRTCYDALKKHPLAQPAIIGFYARYLHAGSGTLAINRAAFAIGQLDGHSAIPQLIDVLVTTHTETKVVKAPGPSMSPGGSGLGWGQNKVEIVRDITNPEVRHALMRLTGKDFLFNKNAWKAWLIQSRRTPTFDARRG